MKPIGLRINMWAFVLILLFGALLFSSKGWAFSPTIGTDEEIVPIGEWEGTRRLVMVFQKEATTTIGGENGQQAILDAYLRVMREALSHVNVTIILPSKNELVDLLKWIHKEGLGPNLRDGRLKLEAMSLDSRWIRDYGALLGRGKKSGKLYAIDLVYPQNSNSESRSQDEKMAYRLFQDSNISWIRSPIKLDGGNFDTDGKGICFTSTATLGENETSRSEMSQKFRDYLGCRETVYLRKIPLESTGHLDTFFKVLTPDIWILGHYLPNKNPKVPMEHLESLANEAMEKNEAIINNVLRKRGSGRLVRMPMPRPYPYRYYDSASEHDGNMQISDSELDKMNLPPLYKVADNRIIKKDIAFPNYVNSLYLRGARGEVVVIPTYSTSKYDAQAVAIYRQIYPSAKIVRMPSDYLIQEEGSAHCVLYAMPE